MKRARPNKKGQRNMTCPTCKIEMKATLDPASGKVMLRCPRCGRTFQTRPL
jgi:transcription elongation factor Elf1